MKRAWIGAALLAASWLFGLSYYHQAQWPWWALLVAGGVLLLVGRQWPVPPAPAALIAAAALIPAIWLLRWPYRIGPLLLAVGLVLGALPLPRRWPRRLGAAAAAAGLILLAQTVAMEAYEALTARTHLLPAPLGRLLAAAVGLLGVDATYDGQHLVLFSMRRIHPLAATWELLLDPVTVCFLVAAVVLIALAGRSRLRSAGVLVLAVLAWLPLRAGLLTGLYLHRVLRTEYEATLNAMDQFWNPWLHLALLAGPVLLAWRLVREPAPQAPQAPAAEDDRLSPISLWPIELQAAPAVASEPPAERPSRLRGAGAIGLALLAGGLITTAVLWHPVGTRKGGRVLIDEFHSAAPWPFKDFDTVRTDRRFDTEWYGHDSAYNLSCLYDYASRFYDMSRTTGPITAARLADVDVLVLKVPSLRYGEEEIQAIHDFVDRGGGLLLIGEHTSVFGSGVNLNDIARPYGFEFRYDCLFGIDSVFEQHYTAPIVPHPIVQRVKEMDFAVSCSIRSIYPGGCAPIRATGLKSRPANYHASNFYPPAEDDPAMRYGAFAQAWATHSGQGRVAAFTDSTIFASFSTFEPGKSELFLGMVEWLNHSGGAVGIKALLAALAVVAAVAAVVLAVGGDGPWMLVAASAVLGWSIAAGGVRAAAARAMPAPEPVRDMVRVGIDRTISRAPLPKSGFIGGKDGHFGQFERSILRLGYFTFRASGEELTQADAIVVLDPSAPVDRPFRDRLARYVRDGGKLLVLDGPGNARSTANNLLWPFGMKLESAPLPAGTLAGHSGWPAIPVPSARRVSGGHPLATLDGVPVAAAVRYGKGTVTVVGFSSRFTDLNMGVIGDVVPDEKLRPVFDFEYVLLRSIVQDALPGVPPPGREEPGAGNREPGETANNEYRILNIESRSGFSLLGHSRLERGTGVTANGGEEETSSPRSGV